MGSKKVYYIGMFGHWHSVGVGACDNYNGLS